MARTIRFGIIGGGLMGREFASAVGRWMALVDHSAKPQIVHVADPVLASRAWFADALGCRVSENHRTLLDDPQVEAVYVAVPHDLHEMIYLDVLRAGKHLFAEKPFGIDLPAAERIAAEARRRTGQLVRVSSEFPFFPAAQRIAKMSFGRILEVHAAFLHSSDLDPTKLINWKRRNATNGLYGCMGDLGLHVLHLPLRLGWAPCDVRALLVKAVEWRPDGEGDRAPCETWDNATLACRSARGNFPMVLETKRISPGDTNTWTIRVVGTENSAEFTTKRPKTLRTLPYRPGEPQAWREEDLGHASAWPTITGGIFEFGFPDAILQMWASYCAELVGVEPAFRCATVDEALASHRLFTAALESERMGGTVAVQ